jgi:hypothetical protein
MKIVNLDNITTKRDKIIVLGGVEHVMHTPTVQDYIEQMKQAEEINRVSHSAEAEGIEGASQILNLTIATLLKSFPTLTDAQLRKLTMDQLNAIRMLADDAVEEEAPQAGEATGKLG